MGLGEAQLRDACYNDRVAALTDSPPLPRPPPPMVIIGPDARSHRLAYRILRAPAGVEVKLEETGWNRARAMTSPSWADHDARVAPLLGQVRTVAEREVARQYLEPAPPWSRLARHRRRGGRGPVHLERLRRRWSTLRRGH